MSSRILLCLDTEKTTGFAVTHALNLCALLESRLHVLSIFDDRLLQSLWANCGSSAQAAHLLTEHNHLRRLELRTRSLHEDLAGRCREAGIGCEIRQKFGDPFVVLADEVNGADRTNEKRYELVVTDHSDRWDGLQMAAAISRPLLIVRRPISVPQRVLLAYDGTVASLAAIESFLRQPICEQSDLRLIAVSDRPSQARKLLAEIGPLLDESGYEFERGYLAGPFRRELARYSRKWEADLVVAGASSKSRLLERFFGSPLDGVFDSTDCSLYLLHRQVSVVTEY